MSMKWVLSLLLAFCCIYNPLCLCFQQNFNACSSFSTRPRTCPLSATQISLDQSENAISEHQVLTLVSERDGFLKMKPEHSPVSWKRTFEHVGEKITWEKINNPEGTSKNLQMITMTIDEFLSEKTSEDAVAADVILMVGLQSSDIGITQLQNQSKLTKLLEKANAIATLDCDETITKWEKFGSYIPSLQRHASRIGFLEDRLSQLKDFLNPQRKKDRKVFEIAKEGFQRQSLDDLVFVTMSLIDTFSDTKIKSVESVTSTETTSLQQLKCMCTKCTKEMIECFKDPECRKALDCLNGCKGNDQVCSYRCIVSHETPAFENFARCILQLNNCMNNSAKAPIYPDPPPLATFRGEPLTHEVAEGIFIGHLEGPETFTYPNLTPTGQTKEKWSWKVLAGKNAAYDYFENQHQIFYRDKRSKSSMWYDPVFGVTTLDGHNVWRRRHYRVRRGKTPGSFYFSVLDNGVTSNEYWRILDCAEDLEWAVFYYSGAASAAGTSYTGALIVTKDGNWPKMTPETSARISAALQRGKVEMFEMYEVKNTQEFKAGPPPLDLDYFKE